MLEQLGGRLGRSATHGKPGSGFELCRDMLVRPLRARCEVQSPLLCVRHGRGQTQVQLVPLRNGHAGVMNRRQQRVGKADAFPVAFDHASADSFVKIPNVEPLECRAEQPHCRGGERRDREQRRLHARPDAPQLLRDRVRQRARDRQLVPIASAARAFQFGTKCQDIKGVAARNVVDALQ